MSSMDGLVTAYGINGEGGGENLNWDEIRSWKEMNGLLWIHLDFTHPYARQWLVHESGVDDVVGEALLADETRPRSSIRKTDSW